AWGLGAGGSLARIGPITRREEDAMKRLILAGLGILGLLVTFTPEPVQGQTPVPRFQSTTTQLPPWVLNPWGNPIIYQQQRMQDFRDQQDLNRRITQLQQLEILKSRNKSSTSQADKGATDGSKQGDAKSSRASGKPKRYADVRDRDTNQRIMPQADETVLDPDRKDVKRPAAFAKTTSNWNTLLKKR